jgi:hypothetical protein
MVDGVAGIGGAHALVNTFLREMGSVSRGRSASPAGRVEASEASTRLSGKSELTEQEQRQVDELRRRDQEVRTHESAHKAAAGSHASGGPSFEYATGPDGRQYATEGEVQIDTSEVPNDPQATIRKMQQIRSAAMAPADPSSQDRQVASQAAAAEARARTDLADQRREQQQGGADESQAVSTFALASFGRDNALAEKPGVFIDVTI